MKRKPKKEKPRKADQERGDDVFRNPLEGPSDTKGGSDAPERSWVDKLNEGVTEEFGDNSPAPVEGAPRSMFSYGRPGQRRR
jgi:hypothetical protein